MNINDVTEAPTCSKCGDAPAGPGGILCPGCAAAIKALPSLGES